MLINLKRKKYFFLECKIDESTNNQSPINENVKKNELDKVNTENDETTNDSICKKVHNNFLFSRLKREKKFCIIL